MATDALDPYFNVSALGTSSCKNSEYSIGDLMLLVVPLDKFLVSPRPAVDLIDTTPLVEEDLCSLCSKDVVRTLLSLYGSS